MESEQAWNFALYSRAASSVTLLVYGADDVPTPILELAHDPLVHKTGRIWHCMVSATRVPRAAYYAYKVDGPSGGRNHFVPAKVLCDPYAHRLHFPATFSREAARGDEPNDGRAVLGRLPRREWGDEPAPRRGRDTPTTRSSTSCTSKGSRHANTRRDCRSTAAPSARLIEKIPYLRNSGITVVELLPVQQFDPQEGNYWGYMTMNFFAPHNAYAGATRWPSFAQMVDAFHAAGIEVWLDVVYNHTCEGDLSGPTYSYRASTTTPTTSSLRWLVHRRLRVRQHHAGSRLATRALVLRSLQHWAEQGVDGFRFDLASILAGSPTGASTPPRHHP